MKLQLKRKHGTVGFTDGALYVDGVYFCNTLEDQERDKKIPTATAIPRGTYRVIVDFSNRFQRYMPLLLNVPEFSGVRIHSGNTAKDTEGCILVGKYLTQGYITKSRDTFQALFQKINSAFRAGDNITIEIV